MPLHFKGLKRISSLDTRAFTALEVLDDNCAIKIYLLTYLLIYFDVVSFMFTIKFLVIQIIFINSVSPNYAVHRN